MRIEPVTPEVLSNLAELVNHAVKEEWTFNEEQNCIQSVSSSGEYRLVMLLGHWRTFEDTIPGTEFPASDARLIAAAVTWLPSLLEALKPGTFTKPSRHSRTKIGDGAINGHGVRIE